MPPAQHAVPATGARGTCEARLSGNAGEMIWPLGRSRLHRGHALVDEAEVRRHRSQLWTGERGGGDS